MESRRWTGYIEASSNLAVLVVAMALLGAIVSTRWLASAGKAKFEEGLEKGQVLPQLPSIDYNVATRTLVLALSTTCHYCNESAPFYKRLLAEQQASGNRTQMVAVFPNSKTAVERYQAQNQLYFKCVTELKNITPNVTATTTLIVVDSTGHVLDFWVGKLSKEDEEQVVTMLKSR